MTGRFRGESQRYAIECNRTIAGADARARGVRPDSVSELTAEQRAARLAEIADVFGKAPKTEAAHVAQCIAKARDNTALRPGREF